ncbi:MAG: 16S rRNA (cytosine(1402)-N(4))-methyltransferase RsmH [Chloroflexota bacterium]
MDTPTHTPVLVEEVVRDLAVTSGGRHIDCTVGLGGHAEAVLDRSPGDASLLGIDADGEAIRLARLRLARFGSRVELVAGNFAQLEAICASLGIPRVHSILFDLGVSSLQLDSTGRGFSFQKDASLDMRYDAGSGQTAAEIVNHTSQRQLIRLLREYGEERLAPDIARRIVSARPIESTLHLARLAEDAYGGRGRSRIHPATRTFMALRIAVNNELDNLIVGLNQALNVLAVGGRIAVISYHSLEDRIVKEFFRNESRDCICPPQALVCQCHHVARLQIVSRKVITPSPEEVDKNPRSRSAKLRVAEKTNRRKGG